MRVQEVLGLPGRPASPTEALTSDAVPICVRPELSDNAKALYAKVAVDINISDLADIEKELSPEEITRMLFLMIECGESADVLPQCVQIMKRGDSVRNNNDCHLNLIRDFVRKLEVARQNTNKDWKPLFCEALAVVGRVDILHVLGFQEKEIDILKKAVHLSPTKMNINAICCDLLQEDVTELVMHISSKYLPNDTATTLDSSNSQRLLELHIMNWMNKGVMTPSDLTPLAEALRQAGKRDLAETLTEYVNNDRERPTMNSQSSCQSMASKKYPSKCGVCVVFNFEQFSCDDVNCGLSFREGSSIDANNLVRLFTKFGCLTQTFTDFKAQDTDDLLENLATAENLATFDYLVVCFLSHGDTDRRGKQRICSSDCKKLLVEEELMRRFEAGHCRALDGKLKLVITQSCMGKDWLPPVPAVADGPRRLPVTTPRDFLFLQAATPGFLSYRIPSEGSPYISVLCEVFGEFGEQEELMHCLQMVNDRLSDQRFSIARDGRWISCAIQPDMKPRNRYKFFFTKSN